NGIVSDYTYDGLNRLTDLRDFADADHNLAFTAGDKLKAAFLYNLTADSPHNSATETDDFGTTSVFHWLDDGQNRLTAEIHDTPNDAEDYITVYNYDLVGTRLSKLTDNAPSAAAITSFLAGGPISADQTITYTY